MAITQAITCDVCGKAKGDVNHWWLMEKFPTGFHLWPWGKPSDETIAARNHLCGQECVIKAVSEWMQEQSA